MCFVLIGGCQGPRAALPPAARLQAADIVGTAIDLADLRGAPSVLLFWRSDCGPCLVELEGLPGLLTAANGGSLRIVALEDAAKAKTTAARFHYPTSAVWIATEPAADVLERFGGAPPRLPLAVALDADGRVCATHHGILGTDRAKDWIKQCS